MPVPQCGAAHYGEGGGYRETRSGGAGTDKCRAKYNQKYS